METTWLYVRRRNHYIYGGLNAILPYLLSHSST